MKVKAPFAVEVYRIWLGRHCRIAWRLRAFTSSWYQIVQVVHREIRGGC